MDNIILGQMDKITHSIRQQTFKKNKVTQSKYTFLDKNHDK